MGSQALNGLMGDCLGANNLLNGSYFYESSTANIIHTKDIKGKLSIYQNVNKF